MATIAFDTLAYANKLKQAGLDSKIAEVQAEETAKILSDLTSNELATKYDINDLKLSTKKDFNELELKIEKLKVEAFSHMLKLSSWIIGVLGSLQVLFHFIK